MQVRHPCKFANYELFDEMSLGVGWVRLGLDRLAINALLVKRGLVGKDEGKHAPQG